MMCSDSCKVLSRFETLKPIPRKKNGEVYQRELLRLESLTRTAPTKRTSKSNKLPDASQLFLS